MKPGRRDMVIATSSVVVVMALVAGALLLRPPRPPSAERCAALWNLPANAAARETPEVLGFDRAAVDGSLSKDRFPGCAVLFVERAREPWILFVAWVPEQGPAHWDRVDGRDWGVDSPEGGLGEPNATVSRSGRVILDD